MEKSTIEIKMTNQEIGEITEIHFSTEDIRLFLGLQDRIIDMLNEENKTEVKEND